MSRYTATISWSNTGEDFLKGKYSRLHTWQFDGGSRIDASASPSVVPLPWSREDAVDPEEAFVASLSSCHMLFFLHLASRRNLNVIRYQDNAEGFLEKNEQGRLAMTRVLLHPAVEFADGSRPDRDTLESLHHQAHEQCFIANSVLTKVEIIPAV